MLSSPHSSVQPRKTLCGQDAFRLCILHRHLAMIPNHYKYHISCFSGFPTEILKRWATERMIRRRMKTANEDHRLLIHQGSSHAWGEGRTLSKQRIISKIIGERNYNQVDAGTDAECMTKFLDSADPHGYRFQRYHPNWSSFQRILLSWTISRCTQRIGRMIGNSLGLN